MGFQRPFQFCILAVVLVLCGAFCLHAHSALTPGDDPVPFEHWLAQGEVEEIPWEVKVREAEIAMRQWPVVRLEVRVPGKYLRENAGRHLLTLVARVADQRGQWITPREEQIGRVEGNLPGGAYLRFQLALQTVPGRYQLGFVLYDHATGLRSTKREILQVRGERNDPLAGAYRDLPRASFLRQSEFPEGGYPPARPRDLWLPVESSRPLRVELLVNFSLSEQFAGSVAVYRRNRRSMLAALDVLSQLDLANGSLHLTMLDLSRRRILYEQQIDDGVDWVELRASLEEVHPQVISLEALEKRQENAAFFRDLIRERIRRAQAGAGERIESAGETGNETHSAPADEPLPVFVVVSSGILFPSGSDLEPLPAREAERCDCRVFYLQFRIHRDNLWDKLSHLLRPLRPQRYVLDNPKDFRKALGKLLRELRSL